MHRIWADLLGGMRTGEVRSRRSLPSWDLRIIVERPRQGTLRSSARTSRKKLGQSLEKFTDWQRKSDLY